MPMKGLFAVFPSAGAMLAMLLLAACNDGQRAPAAPAAAGSAVSVTTQVVVPGRWSEVLSALGTVRARESVTVTAKVNETVQRVHFDSGDEVAAGAVLLTLSSRQQQAELAEAEAAAREAERQYARGMQLAQRQLIAQSALDAQRAARDAAAARVRRMQADLDDRRIRAPFSGVLGLRQLSPGALVTPGTAVATLDDITRVYVDFSVPEARLAQLRRGQPLVGTSAAWPGRAFAGQVVNIEARIDPQTRAVMVRGDFPNPERHLRPGMLVQVMLTHAARTALVLPEIALVQAGRETFVWRVGAGGRVERAPVQVAGRRDGQVALAAGIAAGERIVVEGVGKLRPGMVVRDAAVTGRRE